MIFLFYFLKSVNICLLFCFFFGPLGRVIVEMKLDVQYSDNNIKVFLGNFQYSNQKQTDDNWEREQVSVQDCVT